LSWSWGEGERIRYYKLYSPKHSFPFCYYHAINLHLDISISEQLLVSLLSEIWIFLKLSAIIL
jgi:hypothetical protein